MSSPDRLIVRIALGIFFGLSLFSLAAGGVFLVWRKIDERSWVSKPQDSFAAKSADRQIREMEWNDYRQRMRTYEAELEQFKAFPRGESPIKPERPTVADPTGQGYHESIAP